MLGDDEEEGGGGISISSLRALYNACLVMMKRKEGVVSVSHL